MDAYDRRIMQVLQDKGNMTFDQIRLNIDFSYNTIQQHLARLVEKGLVKRRKQPPNSPGRPKYVYNVSESLNGRPFTALMNPETNWVVVSFDSLRRLCRHEKGGYCKEIRGSCGALKCPKTLK